MKILPRNIILLSFISVIFSFSLGCNKIDTVEEFTSWFNNPENGFIREKFVDNIFFRVHMKPFELMTINEIVRNGELNKKEYDSLKGGYEGSVYFILEIGFDERKKDAGNKDIALRGINTYEKYTERIYNLSFNLEESVFLLNGNDTVYPSIYHYERGYELAKKEAITFAFPYTEGNELVFVFIDDIFNTGVNKFQFDQINQMPPIHNVLNSTNHETNKKA